MQDCYGSFVELSVQSLFFVVVCLIVSLTPHCVLSPGFITHSCKFHCHSLASVDDSEPHVFIINL